MSYCRNRIANDTGHYARSCATCGHSRECPQGVQWLGWGAGGGGTSEQAAVLARMEAAEVAAQGGVGPYVPPKPKTPQELLNTALALLNRAQPLVGEAPSVSLLERDFSMVRHLVQCAVDALALRPAEIRITTEEAPPAADAAAHHLWGILEDIDTTDDLAGGSPKGDRAFRVMVQALLTKRWQVAEIREGATTVSWKMPPPEDEPKPS